MKNLVIFKKSINNTVKLRTIKNNRKNFVGNIKYLPPVSKEWKNTIYVFNKNHSINLPANNLNINEIIQHYFNLRFSPQFINKRYKPRWVRRPSMNKIYVSKAEIKHTNSKGIVTIYTYNREKISLFNKIKMLKKKLLIKIGSLIFHNNKIWGNFSKKIIKKLLIQELKTLRKFKLRLNLNKYKFEERFLYKLSNIVGLYLNKKIEFNIINMKSIVFNSDIFTKILSHKLWKKNINVLNMMNYILSKAILPKANRILERTPEVKNVDLNLIENKYNNLHLISVLKNKNFNSLLKELYNDILLKDNKDFTKMQNIIFNNIKYKNMAGIRLEAKGRLTKRYRADRSVFKVIWKGGLKNIYSSFKGLSAIKKRGYLNSNVEYSLIASKRRIGSFAVKGWISGK